MRHGILLALHVRFFYSVSALHAMQTAVIARRDLSVRPSVRLSVRSSHSGVLSRKMKIRSCGLQCQDKHI